MDEKRQDSREGEAGTGDYIGSWGPGTERQRERLRNMPRVIKPANRPPVNPDRPWRMPVIEPTNTPAQIMRLWIEQIPSAGASHKHGHQNEAMFYILEGRGYEVHDGVRYEWQAGDVVVVMGGCVHQHFNADPTRPATALVINPKALYGLANLLTQEEISTPGSEEKK
ncbi:MAG: cupin domain-containing protein [Dehalococcoidia bacterium]|nr:cupin domain-containing protein [Dehalococcoidia bacterium]